MKINWDNPFLLIVPLVIIFVLFMMVPTESEIRFFPPYTDDEAMWQDIMKVYPNYDQMNDLEKTTALRVWASKHLYISGWTNVVDHNRFNNTHPSMIFNHFSTFHNGDAGVMCSGYAHALTILYQYAGFRAWEYDYGGPTCSHAVNLVLVTVPETNDKVVMYQDCYFDHYLAWPNGTPISIFSAMDEVRAGRYENVVPVFNNTTDYGVWNPDNVPRRDGYEFEPRIAIDENSTIYLSDYNMDTYHNTTKYVAARDAFLNTTDANDLDLILYPLLLTDYKYYKIPLDHLRALEGP